MIQLETNLDELIENVLCKMFADIKLEMIGSVSREFN